MWLLCSEDVRGERGGLKDRVLAGWQNNEPDLTISRLHSLLDFLKPEFAIIQSWFLSNINYNPASRAADM